MSDETVGRTVTFAAFVALDWADRKHVWALEAADSDQLEQGEIDHTPEAVEAWAAGLAQRFGRRPVAVALEQAQPALLFMLTKYQHLVLYPVHPTSLARYREAIPSLPRPGLASITSNSAQKEKATTAPSVPWPSSGSALCIGAGRTAPLMTKHATRRPCAVAVPPSPTSGPNSSGKSREGFQRQPASRLAQDAGGVR